MTARGRAGAALAAALPALLAAFLAAPAPAAAGGAPAPWEALTRPMLQAVGAQQGLGNVVVTAIAQDRQGFLWVGTAGGLSRWDGYRFRNYTHVPGDPRSLPDNLVQALHVDRRGRLWVGTGAGGLARYVPAEDGFARYDTGAAAVGDGDVMAIAGGAGDELWLATQTGLVHLTGADDPRRARPPAPVPTHSRPRRSTCSACTRLSGSERGSPGTWV